MGINVKRRHVFWGGIIVAALVLLGLAVGQYARGGSLPLPLATGTPLWATDIRDDRKLSGLAHNIWFGQVVEKTGQFEDKEDVPATYYSVTVLESLKGSLPATVTVSKHGADLSDGMKYRVEGDPDLLELGKSYLFVTRSDPAAGFHVVVSGVGNLPLDVEDNADSATVLRSADADRLRERFTEAIANEVPVPTG